MSHNIHFNNGVLYLNDGQVDFLEQPCWPDGTPWANENEARTWADLQIAWMNDPENNPEPPAGPNP